MTLLPIQLLCSFTLLFYSSFQLQSPLDSAQSFIFITLSPDGHDANVNLLSPFADDLGNGSIAAVADDHLPKLSLPSFGQSLKMQRLYNVSMSPPSNESTPFWAQTAADSQNAHLSLYSTKINLEQQPKSNEYALIDGGKNRTEVRKMLKWTRRGTVNDQTPLRVCVFGDYRADVMYTRELNLSNYVVSNGCDLNLFIGKITWEQRDCPKCASVWPNSSVSSPIRGDVGLSFSPFVMLHDNANSEQVSIFASVPSLFGAIGHNLNETTFFDCTEVDGVAFIQTSIEVSTVAQFGGNHQTEQYQYTERYFKETMLNELECKLKEVHRRPLRPWIIVYLTHPSLINEKRTDVLSLKDNDRLFQILNRYKIDLLLSCGVEGMAKTLAERRLKNAKEQLPPYLNTTMATCLNERDCQYLVLEIKSKEMHYWYKSGNGTSMKEGTLEKSTQSADACIPDESLSTTGKNVTEMN